MKTINLLNGKEFCPNISIVERLTEGDKSRSLIYTDNMRGIGKTHNLIEFAKAHNRVVAVSHGAEALRKEYDYRDIYNKNEHILSSCMGIVIDEGVDFSRIIQEECVFTGFTNVKPIITGIIKVFNNDTPVESYDGIISSLKKDAVNLSQKISKEENDSRYKILINNLKSTMELIKDLEGITPKVINISNINLENKDPEEFIKQLQQMSHITN